MCAGSGRRVRQLKTTSRELSAEQLAAPSKLAAVRAAVDTAIAALRPPLPRDLPLVGIAGTVTTLGAMSEAIEP